MAYEFLAAALCTWQKQLRDRGRAYNGVPMAVPAEGRLRCSAPTHGGLLAQHRKKKSSM